MCVCVWQASFDTFLLLICVICTLYGGSKVLLAPSVAQYLRAENANTGVGMSLIAIAAAALVGPGLVTALTPGLHVPADAVQRSAAGAVIEEDTHVYDTFFYVMRSVGALHTAHSGE